MITDIDKAVSCYHCGQNCTSEARWVDDKPFCCQGCQTVFEILDENNLCDYYNLDKNPGITINSKLEQDYEYLNESSIQKRLLTFQSEDFAKVTFAIPAIHCVSCIWLLENLKTLAKGVLRSEVNFTKKSVTISFNSTQISLGKIASTLSSIGYAPQIYLDSVQTKVIPNDNALILKLALAGFCFGNVMLFSFPEYLGLENSESNLTRVFSLLNLALSWPVFLYSANGYLSSALKCFRQKRINIDVPIAAGLVALFARSHYEIITGLGPGYLDSFNGLIFFLLIGRWFQGKTYESLSYERDFKSYFPLAVNRLTGKTWKPVFIYELEIGDLIKVRNQEIIPTDAELLSEEAWIDYSFVTGEARPVKVNYGNQVYAGGKLIGYPVELKVEKKTSQSYLTSLWNNEAFTKGNQSTHQSIIDKTARIFTWVVLGIAIATGLYWFWVDASSVWLTVTAVLMVACPCALALVAPFTYGSLLRSFGRHKLYLKNTDVIERLASIDAVVFDKTGTVTYNQQPTIKLIGHLTEQEQGWIKRLAAGSTHPLSKLIAGNVNGDVQGIPSFKEIPGKGIEGMINGILIKLGTAAFTESQAAFDSRSTHVYVNIGGEPKGYYSISLNQRKDVKYMIARLAEKCVAMLSGDNNSDQNKMKLIFGCQTQLLFNQGPHDKLNFIRNLQHSGKRVLMIGDGLNDSGALKQADVGLAVTDDTSIFTPASDGIIQGDSLRNLDKMIELAQSSQTILKTGFIISFFYNAIALSFAISGQLTPIIAAILMPISSITVVAFSSLAVTWITNKKLSGS